jgi:predicted acylesterase/phospholipase RssA
MEELVAYDPHLVVGILGGGAGTTYDAFKQLADAKKYGARAALYGRKINNAENQLAFIEFLRMIADGQISAEEAVKAYHGVLGRLNIKPQRNLADDMQLTSVAVSYSGGSQVQVPAGMPTPATSAAPNGVKPAVAVSAACPCGGPSHDVCACKHDDHHGDGAVYDPAVLPNFSKMTPAQKIAWNKAKRDYVFGK